MTTEGRPDWTEANQKFWNKTYEQQRRDRLADAVGDYLTCEDTDARQCYEEMLAEVDDWINYHKKFMNKAVKLKELLLGHRDATLDFPHWPGEATNKEFLQENTHERD